MPRRGTSSLRRRLQAAPSRTGGSARAGGSGPRRRTHPTSAIDLSTSPVEQLQHVVGGDAGAWADRLGHRQRPAAGEDRQAPQQHLLALVEQVVAPVDRGADRAVPWQAGRDRAAQARRRRTRAGRQAARRSARARAPRPARAPAECRRRRRRCARSPCALASLRTNDVVDGAGALDEEADRGACAVISSGDRLCCRSGSSSGGTRQAISPSIASGSRLVARTCSRGQAAQQVGGQLGAGVDQVLAVVEHQQQVLRRAGTRSACRSTLRASASRRPTAAATAPGQRRRRRAPASSTSHTPSA